MNKNKMLIGFLCLLVTTNYAVPAFGQEQKNIEQNVIVLLAEFPDSKFPSTVEAIERLVFEDVDDIFREASSQKVSIKGGVIPTTYIMPNTLSYYDREDFDNARFLNDLIPMADKDLNFDNSWVLVYHAGKTRPTGNAIQRQGITGDGDMIFGFARIDSTFSPGITVHELAHLFGMLPDLYDTSSPVDTIRNHYQSDRFYYDLDIMAAKTHGGFSAYSKIKLGWIDEHVIEVKPGQNKIVTLTTVDSCSRGICAVKVPIDDGRYYLIEAREIIEEQNPVLQPKFEGVVVSYVDETTPSGHGPVRLLNINGYSTQFVERHTYDTDSLFVSPEHDFKVTLLSNDDYRIRIGPVESISYHTPHEVKITVKDFLNRPQDGISIDISKEDYTVMRLRTDNDGVARFNALQPGLYGITLNDCFRCIASEPTALIDPNKDSEIQLTINTFIFQVAVILVVIIIAGSIIALLLMRKHEHNARLQIEGGLEQPQ